MTEEAKCTIGVNILKNGLALGEIHEPSLPTVTGDESDTFAQNNIGGVETKCIGVMRNGNLGFKLYFTGSAKDAALIDAIYDRDVSVWTVAMPSDFNGGKDGFNWSGQIAKCGPPVTDGVSPAYLDMEVTVNSKIAHTTVAATGLTTPWFVVKDTETIPNTLTPSPVASGDDYAHTVEAYSDTASVTVTPTAGAGTIYVNGTLVASAATSAALPLNAGVGAVTMASIVVTELNKTPRVYWIKFVIGNTATPE